MDAQPNSMSTCVNLHGISLKFKADTLALQEQFLQTYGHLPRINSNTANIEIIWEQTAQSTAPQPPPDMPILSESDLISHYALENMVAIRLPKYALVSVDLDSERIMGQVTQACLNTYGVFEDVMMISLAPLYRRRGWFPLHAFAGLAPNGKAALLTGEIGAGKTTTGLALLAAGWQLLSNDSPLLTIRNNTVNVLAYPGQLSAFDESLAFFPQLRDFRANDEEEALQKRVFRAEAAFSSPWANSGIAGGLFFPKVTKGMKHSRLTELSSKAALLQLMPQTIESWDKSAISSGFSLLRKLVEQVPSYILELAPDMVDIPGLIQEGMR